MVFVLFGTNREASVPICYDRYFLVLLIMLESHIAPGRGRFIRPLRALCYPVRFRSSMSLSKGQRDPTSSKNKIAVRRRLTAVNCPRSQAQRKSRVRSIIFQFFAESEKLKNNLPFTCKPAIVEREQSISLLDSIIENFRK